MIKMLIQMNINTSNLKTNIEMKISTIPRSLETLDKKECRLVQSSSEMRDSSELDVTAESLKYESKVTLSGSMKTESRDSGVEMLRIIRTKRIPCPDTIHEFDEDDGLTMDRVGK